MSLAQRVQTQRLFEKLDGNIGLTGPQPKPSFYEPAKGEAWIEVQGAINEC